MKHSLFLDLVLCAERARSAHKTKQRNKEFFAARLHSTPNENQPVEFLICFVPLDFSVLVFCKSLRLP